MVGVSGDDVSVEPTGELGSRDGDEATLREQHLGRSATRIERELRHAAAALSILCGAPGGRCEGFKHESMLTVARVAVVAHAATGTASGV